MKVKSSSSNYGSGSFIWKLDEGMGLLLGNTMSARVEQQGNCPWPGHYCTVTKSQWRKWEGTTNLTCEPLTRQPQHWGAQHPQQTQVHFAHANLSNSWALIIKCVRSTPLAHSWVRQPTVAQQAASKSCKTLHVKVGAYGRNRGGCPKHLPWALLGCPSHCQAPPPSCKGKR